MAAGDGVVGDDQYQLDTGTVIGLSSSLLLGGEGVTGWDDAVVLDHDTDNDLAAGASGGSDTDGARVVALSAIIDEDTEADARAALRALRAEWRASGRTDLELHRQVAGVHEYLVGRPRGLTASVTQAVKVGIIPVLCMFRVLDPEVYEESS